MSGEKCVRVLRLFIAEVVENSQNWHIYEINKKMMSHMFCVPHENHFVHYFECDFSSLFAPSLAVFWPQSIEVIETNAYE